MFCCIVFSGLLIYYSVYSNTDKNVTHPKSIIKNVRVHTHEQQ